MRLGIMFSSGKDSTFTLWYYLEQGWDVACLVSMTPTTEESYMFQQPSIALLRSQADSLQIPLLLQSTHGEKEAELDDLQHLLQRARDEYGVEGIAVGALASDYQAERVNRICHTLGLKTYTPLWHKNQEQILREMIAAGFDVRMTAVAAEGLDKSWLGRRLTNVDVDKLVALHKKLGLHVAGEGGEYETIVLDGPIFAQPIPITFTITEDGPCRAALVLQT